MPSYSDAIWADLQAIRSRFPLIHNITNYVVMEHTANALLAVGASPVMAHAAEEVEEMAALANALVLNIGTLSSAWMGSMLSALQTANSRGAPVILDPVGAGATLYRTTAIRSILNHGRVAAIRGNASEIAAIAGGTHAARGVDSVLSGISSLEYARSLALRQQCVVSASGSTDVITDGARTALVHNGHPLMTRVTGMGCAATAIAAAFLAVNADPFEACVHAATVMGLAGEAAADRAEGPGAFKPAFMDALYRLSAREIADRLRLEVLP